MVVTESQLRSCGVNLTKAKIYAPLLSKYSDKYQINTQMRMAHFLAQVLHESACLNYVKELASGAAYDTGRLAKMLGNTPEADGDGQRYKGRGLIQITGRTNYTECGKGLKLDLISHPELLEKPEYAVWSACWYWDKYKLNLLADKDQLTNITKKINGGTNGLSNRLALLGKAKKALRG